MALSGPTPLDFGDPAYLSHERQLRRIFGAIQDQRIPGRQIEAAIDSYKAAIVELVLDGTLTVDDGQRLGGMVEEIVHDLAKRNPDHPVLNPEPAPCPTSPSSSASTTGPGINP